jgi:hypothetical protein
MHVRGCLRMRACSLTSTLVIPGPGVCRHVAALSKPCARRITIHDIHVAVRYGAPLPRGLACRWVYLWLPHRNAQGDESFLRLNLYMAGGQPELLVQHYIGWYWLISS